MNFSTMTAQVRACDLVAGDIAIYTDPESGATMTFEVASLFPTKATGLVCFETTAGDVVRCGAGLVLDRLDGIEESE